MLYIFGHSECADSDVHSLNTTIVEGPIERHKITASFTRDRRRAHWHIPIVGEAWTGPNLWRNGRESYERVHAGGKPLDGTKL